MQESFLQAAGENHGLFLLNLSFSPKTWTIRSGLEMEGQ
jgi:hypothetical protein